MCEDGCTIGKIYDEHPCLVTFNDIKDRDFREYIEEDFGEFRLHIRPISDYLDKRKGYMAYFNYCPYCGEKIDWKAMRRKAKESE